MSTPDGPASATNALVPRASPAEALAQPPAISAGSLTLYQLYAIGDEVALDRAQTLLAKTETSASRPLPPPVRRAESIQIAAPPLRLDLPTPTVELAGHAYEATLRASVYDLGAVALALELALPENSSWESVAALFAEAQDLPAGVQDRFLGVLDDLEITLKPAVTRPERSGVVEDYGVLHVGRLANGADGTVMAAADLANDPSIRAALLGEWRPLSREALGPVVAMSYYPEDLALLSWNGAVLVEPDQAAAATAMDLLEFANVELLLLRLYDSELDEQVPAVYRRITESRRRLALPFVRSYQNLIRDVHLLVAEVTDIAERIDNALKVTDDVYWNRLYTGAVQILRVDVWRRGVEHKLQLLRETYQMLHDEAAEERSTALEVVIVLLIAFEIVLAFVRP